MKEPLPPHPRSQAGLEQTPEGRLELFSLGAKALFELLRREYEDVRRLISWVPPLPEHATYRDNLKERRQQLAGLTERAAILAAKATVQFKPNPTTVFFEFGPKLVTLEAEFKEKHEARKPKKGERVSAKELRRRRASGEDPGIDPPVSDPHTGT